MKIRELIAVLEGWDPELKVVDRESKPIFGARLIETKDGVKVKLGS